MQLNLEEIRAIAKMAKEKGLDQVVVESTDADAPACRLQLRKLQQPVAQPAATDAVMPTADAAQAETHMLLVTSPTVGIFRFGETPVTKGQQVRELEVVGLVESLKVPNEVRLTKSGVVETVFVEDGQGVEFGQPLLEVQINA